MFFGHLSEEMNEFTGVLHGVYAQMRLAGMPFEAGDGSFEGDDAFMGGDNLHEGGFADDGISGFGNVLYDMGKKVGSAEAADFFVIRKGEPKGFLGGGGLELRHQGEANGDEGFHVGGAAAKERVAFSGESEGIGNPGLAFYGYHIRVAGEDGATDGFGADAGEKIAFVAIGRGDAGGLDAVGGEIAFDIVDEGQVGQRAYAVEADELF